MFIYRPIFILIFYLYIFFSLFVYLLIYLLINSWHTVWTYSITFLHFYLFLSFFFLSFFFFFFFFDFLTYLSNNLEIKQAVTQQLSHLTWSLHLQPNDPLFYSVHTQWPLFFTLLYQILHKNRCVLRAHFEKFNNFVAILTENLQILPWNCIFEHWMTPIFGSPLQKSPPFFWCPHRMTPFFRRNLTPNAPYFRSPAVGTCTSLSYLSAPGSGGGGGYDPTCFVCAFEKLFLAIYEELISKTSYIHSYTCYSFADQVTAKKPINTKLTANEKCWY